MAIWYVLVWTVMGYGAEIWGWEERKEIEGIHERFIRWTLHCKNSRVVMWVESTHNTLSMCVAAGTWVDAMCVARNAYSMRANSTRPSRVAHGTHF